SSSLWPSCSMRARSSAASAPGAAVGVGAEAAADRLMAFSGEGAAGRPPWNASSGNTVPGSSGDGLRAGRRLLGRRLRVTPGEGRAMLPGKEARMRPFGVVAALAGAGLAAACGDKGKPLDCAWLLSNNCWKLALAAAAPW